LLVLDEFGQGSHGKHRRQHAASTHNATFITIHRRSSREIALSCRDVFWQKPKGLIEADDHRVSGCVADVRYFVDGCVESIFASALCLRC
jgi:hypothetical protein